jgi:ATP10 protein
MDELDNEPLLAPAPAPTTPNPKRRRTRWRNLAVVTLLLAPPAVYFGVFRQGRCTDHVGPIAITKAGQPMMFPTIHAKTLAKRCVVFPSETKGKVGLVFVAFEQRAQADINTWVDPLITDYLASPDVEYYEIPMISGAYRPVARLIDGGMRGGVPVDLHDRTATFYGDRRRFFAATAITDESKPYLFVLNRTGHVVYRTDGPATPETIAATRQAIEAEIART